MAWATITQFKANQVNLAATGDALITLSLNATGSQISSCLRRGGYSVSALVTAVAAGAVFDLLVLLNIRLAALDLMAGGGVSSYSGSNEKTYLRWSEMVQELLDQLCAGGLALDNSGTGDDVLPPAADMAGIVSDSREAGIDLTDPLLWDNVDPVDSDYSATEV